MLSILSNWSYSIFVLKLTEEAMSLLSTLGLLFEDIVEPTTEVLLLPLDPRGFINAKGL